MPRKNKKKFNKSSKRNRVDGMGVAASSLLAANKNKVKYLESPVKSNLDDNEYRVILLPNGLKVTLIAYPKDESDEANNGVIYKPFYEFFAKLYHVDNLEPSEEAATYQNSEYYQKWEDVYDDDEIDYAASCFLCVNVGTMSNPRKIPGVSSVLTGIFQDPLFDTEQESSDDDDDVTLKSSQIYVEERWEETIYYFSVNRDRFHETLKTFAQSFINNAPSRNHTEMEQKSLENPYSHLSNKLPEFDDESKAFMELVTTRHPIKTAAHSFCDSLVQTPPEKLYREVVKFCKRHYSANRITVVLKAELPLNVLESYAIECFSKIPNNGLPPQTFKAYNFSNSFDNTKFRRIWIINADYESPSPYEMKVHWIMPPSSWLYKAKSLEYLSRIFSDFGTGNLRYYLIKKKWALDVIAEIRKGNPWNTSLYSTFTIVIELTNEGNNHIIEILDAVYSYINLLKREGPQQSFYEKLRTNENAKFRYENNFYDMDLPVDVEDMHLYESVDYIAGPHLYYEYDPVSIKTCMELMAPTKGCIFINNEKFLVPFKTDGPSCKKATGGSIEIPEYLIERWKTIKPLPEFTLPQPNRYWPDDYTIIDTPKTYSHNPYIVHSDVLSEVWYKFDPTVRAPTCNMNLCYLSPLPLESAENSVMLTFFAKVLQGLISNELKLARKAGLFGFIEMCSSGLIIRVYGFRDKLPLLMETIARHVRESYFRVTKKLFECTKSASYEEYNTTFSSSCLMARDIRKSIVKPGCWTAIDKYSTLQSITFAKFRNFLQQFTDHVYIKCLVQGNVTKLLAVETTRKVVKQSKCGALAPNTIRRRRINEIPLGKRCCKVKIGNPTEEVWRHSINYHQFDSYTLERTILIDALEIFFEDARFSKIRDSIMGSNKILCVQKDYYGVNNYWFEHGGKDNPLNINDKIELLNQSFLTKFMSAFTDEMWAWLKAILTISKSGFIGSHHDEFRDNWKEIINGECTFDRRSRELYAVMNLELKDFKDFLTNIANDDLNFRKLSITVIGSLQPLESEEASNSVKHQNRSRNSREHLPIQFEYLTTMSEEKEETPDYYITDIAKYKSELERPSYKNGSVE